MTSTSNWDVTSFEMRVPDDDLADLRRRLAATGWPTGETVTDGSPGARLAKMRELTRHWVTRTLTPLPGYVVQYHVDHFAASRDQQRMAAGMLTMPVLAIGGAQSTKDGPAITMRTAAVNVQSWRPA